MAKYNFRCGAVCVFLAAVGFGISNLARSADTNQPGVSSGQPNTSSDQSSTNSESKPLDEVIVKGQRPPGERSPGLDALGDIPIVEVPLSISSFDSEAVANMQARSFGDIIRREPGVTYAANEVLIPSFNIRGFDAVQTIEGQQNYGDNTGEASIPVELLENVQIIKGVAGGLLYGITPPGGIINYLFKQPLDHSFANVSVGNTSNSLAYGSVDADLTSADDRAGLRFNAVTEQGRSNTWNRGINRYAMGLDAGWQISDTTKVRLDADMWSRELYDGTWGPNPAYPGAGLPALPSLDQPFSSGDRIQETQAASFLKANLIQELGPNWTILGLATFMHTRSLDYALAPQLTNIDGAYDAYEYQYGGINNSYTVQALLKGKFNLAWFTNDVAVGIRGSENIGYTATAADGNSFEYLSLGSGNLYAPNVNLMYPAPLLSLANTYKSDEDWENSIFFSDKIGLSPNWGLLLGGRKIWYRNQGINPNASYGTLDVEQSFSPAAAVTYKTASGLNIYASYAQSVLPGGVVTPGGFAINIGATLAPVKSNQYEIGTKLEYHGALFAAALFSARQDLETCYKAGDLQVNQFGCTAGVYGFQRNKGGEFSVQGSPVTGLTVFGGMQYLTATLISGYPIFNGATPLATPRIQIAANADYSPPKLPGFAFNIAANTISSYYLDTFDVRNPPGYTLLDGGVRFHFASPPFGSGVTLRVSVENIFNKEVWTPQTYGALEPNSARTYKLLITQEFK
jgi:iron complex outermembrane recepter protein